MRNYKKLNRLYESVETPQMMEEIAACGLSEFMSKLDGCCANDMELQSKVDSLKALVGELCSNPTVTAAFAPVAEPMTEPTMEPTMEPAMEPTSQADPTLSAPVPTFGEFTQGSPNQEYNVPSFGA